MRNAGCCHAVKVEDELVERSLKGRCFISGKGRGLVMATSQPISFWGGVDPQTGCITDPRHELFGQSISGKVLVFPFGKGSSGAPPVLLELSRTEKAPAAIINLRTDPILAIGPVISKYFYDKVIPIVNLDEKQFQMLKNGQQVCVDAFKGTIAIKENPD